MADDALKTCPECHEDSLRRLIGGGLGIIFKGSGFYVNDAKKSSSTSQPLKEKKKETKKEAVSASSGKSDSQSA